MLGKKTQEGSQVLYKFITSYLRGTWAVLSKNILQVVSNFSLLFDPFSLDLIKKEAQVSQAI